MPPLIIANESEKQEASRALAGPKAKDITRQSGRFSRSSLGWILVLAFFIFACAVLSPRHPIVVAANPPPRFLLLAKLVVWGGIAAFILTWMAMVKFRKARTDTPNANGIPLREEYSWTEEGLAWEKRGVTGLMKWAAFCGYIETSTMFILQTRPGFGQIISKRGFTTPDEMAAFRMLLNRHLPPGGRGV